ncbi:MAG TPA: hypothetical protein VGI51_09800 [Steroidobacteraceae bacterium]
MIRFHRRSVISIRLRLLATLLAGSIGLATAFAQAPQGADEAASAAKPAAPDNKPAVPAKPAATAKPAASAKPAAPAKAAASAKKSATAAKPAAATTRYKPDRFAGRAGSYYKMVWGVDSLGVKTVESGEVIRFTYRVLDPDKAKTLNDEKVEPSLNDARAGVSLVVPSLEKVGKLRQVETPEEGKSYWMAFSNKGRMVKRGDRVDVVIGQFHANGLVVD